MEPMNAFLTSHRQEFKAYVDEICSISADHRTSTIPPSYAAPITILGRLPGTSREGFPSLPYLIDQARECAGLVDVWLGSRKEIDNTGLMSEELKNFDDLCEASREKSKQCLTRAEQAERPSGTLEPKWEELVEQMDRKARFKEPNGCTSPNTPTAEGSIHSIHSERSSASSLTDSYIQSHKPRKVSPGTSRLIIAASPTSPRSPDWHGESDSETDTPPGSSSSVWDPGVHNENQPPSDSEMIDDVDLDIPDDHSAIGSSIYSLTPTSKRTSTSTSSTIVHKPIPLITPSYNRRHAGPRSTYSLRRSSDRADISKTVGPRGTGITPRDGTRTSREGVRSRDGPQSTPKSMYRLNTSTSSQNAFEPSNLKSPASKNESGSRLRLGDLGGVFKKKGKE